MAEPRILLLSTNADLSAALASPGILPGGIHLLQVADPTQAAALLTMGTRDDYPLCLVDLNWTASQVERLVGLLGLAGIPWLAVADQSTPRFQEQAESLGAIDFAAVDPDDPSRLARFVTRLLKNRGVRLLVVEDSAFMP